MAPSPPFILLVLLLAGATAASAAGGWHSVLTLLPSSRGSNGTTTRSAEISLRNYCESWRLNVELNNIRRFRVVPAECAGWVGEYMTSSGQYRSDVERAVEECTLYLAHDFALARDGKDAWVFDVDEALLSTVPFYEKHSFGGERTNKTLLENWMAEAKAPSVEPTLRLYKHIMAKGIRIFLLSSRKEHLRAATVDNLISVGYHGWSRLILRSVEDNDKRIGQYKADERKKLVDEGYRLWAVVSSQWSSLFGDPSPLRIFKLPNPMYYEY